MQTGDHSAYQRREQWPGKVGTVQAVCTNSPMSSVSFAKLKGVTWQSCGNCHSALLSPHPSPMRATSAQANLPREPFLGTQLCSAGRLGHLTLRPTGVAANRQGCLQEVLEFHHPSTIKLDLMMRPQPGSVNVGCWKQAYGSTKHLQLSPETKITSKKSLPKSHFQRQKLVSLQSSQGANQRVCLPPKQAETGMSGSSFFPLLIELY